MPNAETLRTAIFNPKVKTYWLLNGCLILLITVVGTPLILIWWIAGQWITQRYLDRMECTLTTKTLIVRKGLLVRVEKVIPLDKITDLGMIQGPIMRALDLHSISIETAGSTGAGALVKLVGIEDVEGFRDSVLAQRDRMLESGPSQSAVAAGDTGAGGGSMSEAVELLREIRDELRSHRASGA